MIHIWNATKKLSQNTTITFQNRSMSSNCQELCSKLTWDATEENEPNQRFSHPATMVWLVQGFEDQEPKLGFQQSAIMVKWQISFRIQSEVISLGCNSPSRSYTGIKAMRRLWYSENSLWLRYHVMGEKYRERKREKEIGRNLNIKSSINLGRLASNYR